MVESRAEATAVQTLHDDWTIPQFAERLDGAFGAALASSPTATTEAMDGAAGSGDPTYRVLSARALTRLHFRR